MGFLKNGLWNNSLRFNVNEEGSFDRPNSIFREGVSLDHPQFKPERNRYHLYVSYACPWAHRTLIMRSLKQLESIISVSVVMPDMLENGWEFGDSFENATKDHLNQNCYLYEVYQKSDPTCTCRVTVPVLFDKYTQKIVNNESSEIIRIFNTSFNLLTNNNDDYYPKQLRSDIDAINEVVYHAINNGVYKVGFSQTQAAYDVAVNDLFNQLDKLDSHLNSCDYLVGNQLTEADIRLIPTLLRFDSVYHTHFKCNKKQLRDYPNLYSYSQHLFNLDAIKTTTFFSHIIRHYYYSHKLINPYQIVPVCPDPVF
ncbi:glutathione-dependent reductase [bacterium]|nr:glutathione-dependent reductase [bacterium]|tara:strand:- start:632 stop:1564 length:933 start_codon:yes stop_codon:yes gene_type:complete